MEKIIDLDDIETYPKQVLEYLKDNKLTEFPKLSTYFLEYINTLYCNFYHYTRIPDKQFVLKNGLLPPATSDLLKDYYINILENLYYKEENINFRNLIYNYKYETSGNSVHVTAPLIKSREFKSKGVFDFINYWGGELIKDIIEPIIGIEKWKKTHIIGVPCIVNIKVSLQEMSETELQRIIYIMQCRYKEKRKIGMDYTFYRDIAPNEIIEIFDIKY